MNPEIMRLAYKEIDGPIVIGRVRQVVADRYDADSRDVYLSYETLLKQSIHHKDIDHSFYEDVSWITEEGEFLKNRRENCFIMVGSQISQERRLLFKATLKVVKSVRRILLMSVHRIGPSDYRRLVRKASKS